ncbi:MAG: cysteine desulfurase NifS [Ruminococcaceae bacterium]|nr:cysteine desulfurase NifS [Oscillospiraceae bacterium]
MDRKVYADNAATTPVDKRVVEAMLPYFTENWGNPSSLYSVGNKAKAALDDARARIAALIGAEPSEIFFTSCGTESDNWAIKGTARANAAKGKHIVTSSYEHHAVMHTMRALKKEGFEITYVKPGKDGIVSPADVKDAIREDTILVTVMMANNEIGTINPIKEIAQAAHERRIPFFTDAVQAVGHIPVDVKELGVDMLSFSGHKFNAPKGIGALYIKKGTRINVFLDGGGQERSRRGGTENLPYIIGMAKALELAVESFEDNDRVLSMRNRLTEGLKAIPYSHINGSLTQRLPGNINVAFEFVEGESLLLLLDHAGICASTGSACSSTSLEPSHVLLSVGLPVEIAHGSLRFSLSHNNTEEDVDYILEVLPKIVERLRMMSPLYDAAERR